jgi:predicted nucleotidyltransferase
MSKIEISKEAIAPFCRRWKVSEFALFGSALRNDLGLESDVDVLVSFAPDARWTLFDMVDIQEELGAIIGRKVHLVTCRGIESSRNYMRR